MYCSRTKLTAAQVQHIFASRCVWDCPAVNVIIAHELGKLLQISEKTIRDIWNGRTWTDVTGMPPPNGDNRRPPGRPKGSKNKTHRPRYRRVTLRHLGPGSIDHELFEWAETEFVGAALFEQI